MTSYNATGKKAILQKYTTKINFQFCIEAIWYRMISYCSLQVKLVDPIHLFTMDNLGIHKNSTNTLNSIETVWHFSSLLT